MKKILLCCLVFILNNVFAQKINAQLAEALDKNRNKNFDVIVIFKNQIDLNYWKQKFEIQKTKPKERAGILKKEMLRISNNSVQEFSTFFNQHNKNRTIDFQPIWIINSIALKVSKDEIEILNSYSNVEEIVWEKSYPLKWIEPTEMLIENNVSKRSLGGIEPGLAAIKAPFMWNLGYTGRNMLLYTFDTGIWPNHPAIKSQFLGNRMPYSLTWNAFDSPFPADKSSSHGTHVTGTVLGLERQTNDTIGVAMSAYCIATDPIVSNIADIKPLTLLMTGYQFAFDPDNNPNTTTDVPDVINNSWGRDDIDTSICTGFVSQIFDAVHAAGIANVFSAGNEGPGVSTVGSPAFVVTGLLNSFTVGALDANTANLSIANFSSRGPSLCPNLSNSEAIRPEVSAPGVNVRSAVGQNQYSAYSGTSMASPHVSGAVLLLKEAFPNLSGEEILGALYYSAVDLGNPGEDNTYGMGIINLENAFNYLSLTHTPTPPLSKKFDAELAISENVSSIICNANQNFPITLINKGDSVLTQGVFKIVVNNGAETTLNWSGSLPAGQSTIFNINGNGNLVNGDNEIFVKFEITQNLSSEEWDFYNNHTILRFKLTESVNFPYFENFESKSISQANMIVVNPDLLLTWDTIPATGNGWSQNAVGITFSNYNPRLSQLDDLILPTISIPQNSANPKLAFDLAYQFKNSNFSDSLKIYVSDNCNQSKQRVYAKSRDALETTDDESVNFIPNDSSDWRREVIDLSSFKGEDILITFQGVNRRGGNLYVDNIAVYDGVDPVLVNEIENFKIQLFPIPAQQKLTIQYQNVIQENTKFEVFDLSGKSLQTNFVNQKNGTLEIDISNYQSGIYFLKINNEKQMGIFKFIKN